MLNVYFLYFHDFKMRFNLFLKLCEKMSSHDRLSLCALLSVFLLILKLLVGISPLLLDDG